MDPLSSQFSASTQAYLLTLPPCVCSPSACRLSEISQGLSIFIRQSDFVWYSSIFFLFARFFLVFFGVFFFSVFVFCPGEVQEVVVEQRRPQILRYEHDSWEQGFFFFFFFFLFSFYPPPSLTFSIGFVVRKKAITAFSPRVIVSTSPNFESDKVSLIPIKPFLPLTSSFFFFLPNIDYRRISI